MPKKESHVLHNLTQYLIAPIVLMFVALEIYPSLDPWEVLAVTAFASMFPDVDHINIWLEYKFKNFEAFVKFVTQARRYRYSFLVFHNLVFIVVLLVILPFSAIKNPFAGIFVGSFIAHLLLDLVDDWLSIGRVTHWRYRRRT